MNLWVLLYEDPEEAKPEATFLSGNLQEINLRPEVLLRVLKEVTHFTPRDTETGGAPWPKNKVTTGSPADPKVSLPEVLLKTLQWVTRFSPALFSALNMSSIFSSDWG